MKGPHFARWICLIFVFSIVSVNADTAGYYESLAINEQNLKALFSAMKTESGRNNLLRQYFNETFVYRPYGMQPLLPAHLRSSSLNKTEYFAVLSHFTSHMCLLFLHVDQVTNFSSTVAKDGDFSYSRPIIHTLHPDGATAFLDVAFTHAITGAVIQTQTYLIFEFLPDGKIFRIGEYFSPALLRAIGCGGYRLRLRPKAANDTSPDLLRNYASNYEPTFTTMEYLFQDYDDPLHVQPSTTWNEVVLAGNYSEQFTFLSPDLLPTGSSLSNGTTFLQGEAAFSAFKPFDLISSGAVTRYMWEVPGAMTSRFRLVWTWLFERNTTDSAIKVPITAVFDFTNAPYINQAWVFLDPIQYEIFISNITTPAELYCDFSAGFHPTAAPLDSPSSIDLQPSFKNQNSPFAMSEPLQEPGRPFGSPGPTSTPAAAPASTKAPKSSGRISFSSSSSLNSSVFTMAALVVAGLAAL